MPRPLHHRAVVRACPCHLAVAAAVAVVVAVGEFEEPGHWTLQLVDRAVVVAAAVGRAFVVAT